MKMKKLLTLAALSVLMVNESLSQDFHLTQYDAAPQYMNPALTGVFDRPDGDYRIGMNYRSQWKAMLAKPYSTAGLNYDMKINDQFNAGIMIMSNKAVAGDYNSFALGLSGSYNVITDKKSPHKMTTGLQLGLLNLSTSGSDFNFGTQYSVDSETGFDPTIDPQENFTKQSIFRFDAAFGIYYRYQESSAKWSPYLGVSVYHIPRPKESFTGHDAKLPMRWNFNAGSNFFVNDEWTVTPTILVMSQAKVMEINAGVIGTYLLKENGDVDYRLLFGLNYRHMDAIAFQLGIVKSFNTLRLSYDFNNSYLKNYTNGRGAFELSLILHGKKGEDFFKSFTSF
jgi:type IX secretion system PorP/SprF family membrane protein